MLPFEKIFWHLPFTVFDFRKRFQAMNFMNRYKVFKPVLSFVIGSIIQCKLYADICHFYKFVKSNDPEKKVKYHVLSKLSNSNDRIIDSKEGSKKKYNSKLKCLKYALSKPFIIMCTYQFQWESIEITDIYLKIVSFGIKPPLNYYLYTNLCMFWISNLFCFISVVVVIDFEKKKTCQIGTTMFSTW